MQGTSRNIPRRFETGDSEKLMSGSYTEDALIEQPAIALFGGDLLQPKLISGQVEVARLEVKSRATHER
jgi:hypothetical protein